MKNLFSKSLFILSFMLASSVFAQSDLTLVVKEKNEKLNAKKSEYAFTIKGFKSQKQAGEFYAELRKMENIASVVDLGQDAADGTYKAIAKVKEPKGPYYYVRIASKMGVDHVEMDGQKKTTKQWMDDIEAQKKKHAEEHEREHHHD